jgi:hypothetical protein
MTISPKNMGTFAGKSLAEVVAASKLISGEERTDFGQWVSASNPWIETPSDASQIEQGVDG